MSTRKVVLAPGEFYHVYNRGTDKREIFLNPSDHRRFMCLLYLCNTSTRVNVRDVKKLHPDIFTFDRPDQLVSIGAYCLMPNHFHILITTKVENGISLFMNKLTTSYSMYFNKRYQRTGTLFQGVFKSQFADSDEYLKYMYAYIHLNPVKLIDPKWKEEGISNAENALDFAATFEYSSLPDYLGVNRKENTTLDPVAFPEYFKDPVKIKGELFEWLNYAQP